MLAGLRRFFSAGRPGQPHILHTYEHGAGFGAWRTPRGVRDSEAESMGRLFGSPEPHKRRPVPVSALHYAELRADYARKLRMMRRVYRLEWASRSQRETASAAEAGALAARVKFEADAIRAVERRANRAANDKLQAQLQAARVARASMARRSVGRAVTSMRLRRAKWLAALEEDAKTWVQPETVDAAITPELFSMKYAWQWEGWFAAKEAKRSLMDEARRARRPGAPLREVDLPAAAAPYHSDWESENEGEGVGSSPAGLLASAEAAGDASGRVARALEVARAAARAKGAHFFEPGYSADGLPAPEPGSPASWAQARVDAASAKGGLSLGELGAGKRMKEVIAGYEAWLEKLAKKVPEKHKDVVLRDSEGKVVWDDGERAAENNYIGACIHSGNVEALYYALCRKRARLEREGHEKAAGNFAKVWGGWLSTVEGSLGAQLAGLSAPALPESQLLAAPVAGDDSKEAAEEVAVGSISKEEWDAEVGEEDVVLGEGAKAAGAKGAAGKAGAPAQAGKPAKSNSGRRGAKRAAT